MVIALPGSQHLGGNEDSVTESDHFCKLEQANLQLEAHNAQLSEANADLRGFARAVSHDLREPLRMVSSFSQLLSAECSGEMSEEALKYLEFVTRGATRLQSMLDGLLELSRLERETAAEWVDLDQVLNRVAHDLSESIEKTGADLSVQKLPKVWGNAEQIHRLFLNLLSNALKFCEDRAPQIEVFGERTVRGTRISVKDNGIGIDMKFAKGIFQAFGQLNPRKRFAGTGLGLALCQKIAQRHGGSIEVESTLGEGSVFQATFAQPLDGDRRAPFAT